MHQKQNDRKTNQHSRQTQKYTRKTTIQTRRKNITSPLNIIYARELMILEK
jgi:hypothetical protein